MLISYIIKTYSILLTFYSQQDFLSESSTPHCALWYKLLTTSQPGTEPQAGTLNSPADFLLCFARTLQVYDLYPHHSHCLSYLPLAPSQPSYGRHGPTSGRPL